MKLADCLLIKNIVFNLDERVRYFGFLENRSGMVISELRNRENSHNPEEQLVRDLTFFKGAMSSWALYFGHVNYSLVVHDKFKIIMIPVESGLVIVTSDASLPSQSVEEIAAKVKEEIAALSKL
ncbi:MAG: hypothetical protein PXY39_01295 [archaeon]|nr:hypothetical protein [archaeon]